MKRTAFILFVIFLVSCTGKKEKEIGQYTIDQFYKNLNISFTAFSPDETRLLVSSNETGIYNVFEINIADTSRKQITSSDTKSLFAVNYVHGTNQNSLFGG